MSSHANNKQVKQQSANNLFGQLEQRLNQHNNTEDIDEFANQFEKLQKKRKISYGDTNPTPSNSPAIFDHKHRFHGGLYNQRLVSPLRLNLDRKASSFTNPTPPVTPEHHNNTIKALKPSRLHSIASSYLSFPCPSSNRTYPF